MIIKLKIKIICCKIFKNKTKNISNIFKENVYAKIININANIRILKLDQIYYSNIKHNISHHLKIIHLKEMN